MRFKASTVTDEKGPFLFFGVEEGEHTFAVDADGYVNQSITVQVESDGEQQDFNLGVVELAPEQQESGIVNKGLHPPPLPYRMRTWNRNRTTRTFRVFFGSPAMFSFPQQPLPLVRRFRLRGYDSEEIAVYINGIPFNELENGRVFWSAWGGLNDVVLQQDTEVGTQSGALFLRRNGRELLPLTPGASTSAGKSA